MATRPVSFYADEHVPTAVVVGLRQRGVDVLTVGEAELLGATDEEQLARALRDARVIVTRDADFLRLHATGAEHAGIAYVPSELPVGDVIRRLMLVHRVLDADAMKGSVEFL